MIGIIGAFSDEIEELLKHVKDLKEEVRSIRIFYTGKIKNHDVVIVLAGIGKVNAGVTTLILV